MNRQRNTRHDNEKVGQRTDDIDKCNGQEYRNPSWDDVIAAFDLKKELNYVELLTLRRQYAAARKK